MILIKTIFHTEEQATVRPPLLLDLQLLSAHACHVLNVISQGKDISTPDRNVKLSSSTDSLESGQAKV
jgi:hypothetical protein